MFLKKLFKSNISIYFLSITGAVIGFVLNIVLSRILPLEQLDKVKYLVALVTALSNIFVIGLPSFIIREAKNEEQKSGLMSKCYSLYFVFSMMAAPIMFFVISNAMVYTNEDRILALIVVIASFLVGFDTLVKSFLIGIRKYRTSHLVETIFPKGIILILVSVFFALKMTNVVSDNYLIFYLIVYGIICIYFFIKEFRGFNIRFKKSEILTLLFLYGTTIAQVLSSSLSTILQENLFPEIVGVTSTIATSALLMSVISVFTNVVNSITQPAFAKYAREKNQDAIIDVFQFGTRVNLYLSIPIYLFFIFCPAKFLIIFGEGLTKYPYIFSLVALYNMISSCCGTTGALLTMIGHEKKQLYNTIVQFLVFLGCVFIFRNNEIYGLVLSSMIAEIVVTILKFLEVRFIFKKLPLSPKTLLAILLLLAIDGGSIFAFSYIPINNIIIWYLVAVPFGCLLLFINFFFLPYGKKDFKRFLSFNE